MRQDQQVRLDMMREELEVMADRYGGDTSELAKALLKEIKRAEGELDLGRDELVEHMLRYYTARVQGIYEG